MKPIREIWTERATDPRWVVLLAVVLFGCNLWGYDLWAPDEPFFGEGAREMVADGEWIVPHVNGEVNTHKPPLFFWLIAIFSLPFGEVSSLTARLPSALAGLGSLLLTIRLARRFSGARIAVLAGAMLVTTHMFWEKARMAQIDSLLCFLILVALTAFEAFRAGDWPGRRAGIVFWTAAALAVLAKGPVGLLLPVGIAVLTLVFGRELRRWLAFAPLSGPLAFVAVVGAWALAADLWVPDYSLAGALREHFVDRAIHGMHHEQPVWYYIKVLPYALLPWSFLLPGALLLAWRRRRESDDRFLLVAGLFVLLFFTVSTEKRDLYILPAVPAFAILMARLVAAVAGWWPAAAVGARVPGRKWVTVPLGVTGVLMALASVAAPIAAPRLDAALLAPAAILAAVLGAGGVGTVVMASRGWTLRAVQWAGGGMAAAMLVAPIFVYPPLNPSKSGRELGTVVRDATVDYRAAGQPVLGYLWTDISRPGGEPINVPRAVNFYSGGVYLQHVPSLEELFVEVESGATAFVLTFEEVVPLVPPRLRERMSVVYSTRLSRKHMVFLRFGDQEPTRPKDSPVSGL